MNVVKSTDGEVRLVTRIQAEATSQEIANQFFERFDTDVTETSDLLDVRLRICCVKRWQQNNNRSVITFQDGTRLRGLRNYKLKTTLYVPTTTSLELKSRFEDITIDEEVPVRDLAVTLFTADLHAGEILGTLEMDLKFGKATLKNVGADARIKMHNSRLRMGNVRNIRLDTRFSDIELGDAASLDSKSHNDRIDAGSVQGQLDINGQFSTYTFKEVGDADIRTHNGNFEFERGKNFDVDGKFSDFEIGRLETLKALDSHNNDFDIEELDKLDANAQFSNFRIEKLFHSIDYTGHSGKFRVRSIGEQFQEIDIDGKFFDVDLTIPEKVPYHLSAELNFGGLSAPDHLEVVKQIENHSQKEYVLKTSNAGENSPRIDIVGHNVRVKLN